MDTVYTMECLFVDETITYTGEQLRSHWVFRRFGLAQDAAVAFVGPCDVAIEHMVDQVDVAAGDSIKSASMLHFIIEHFDCDLPQAVLRQRLLVCIMREQLGAVDGLRREGDDLFIGNRKLSVSIATCSPVSTLIHFGVNVDPTGAPVAAAGLAELGIEPRNLAERVLAAYAREMDQVQAARCKVRGVA